MQYVKQFSIDVLDSDDNITEEMIQEAIEQALIPVLGCCWKATWSEYGYENGELPMSCD